MTSAQKNGLWIAAPKCDSVGWSGIQVGVSAKIWSSGLNAVEIIQKTGNAISTVSSSATAFQSCLPRAADRHVAGSVLIIRRT